MPGRASRGGKIYATNSFALSRLGGLHAAGLVADGLRAWHPESMSPVERYSAYDRFAWFYNQGWSADYHNEARAALDKLIFSRLPVASRVLDLCCGTGDMTRTLVAHGYRVTGLDGSEQMLRFARENAPAAQFILADARDFDLPPVFDAVVSTFDSLNHILALPELETVFRNVHRALAQGGLFVFDMNMEEAFKANWHGTPAGVEDTSVWIIRLGYDPDEKVGRADITTFRLIKRWQRSDITVLEKCYSAEEILSGLAGAGFCDIASYHDGNLEMQGRVGVGRTFFSARKPG